MLIPYPVGRKRWLMPSRYVRTSVSRVTAKHSLQPDYIAPIVGYLSSEANTKTSGGLFEIMGGWAAQTRWQKSGGYGFPVNRTLTPEDVLSKWTVFCNFGDGFCSGCNSACY